jgi:hypothetical protein
MYKLKSYLAEEKNVHMEHLEDTILNGGVEGTRQVINYLRALRDMLAGNSKSKVDVTVKWDGAPAIFAGVDPSDGKFFVAKKGIFNKNPKVYKTDKEIEDDNRGKKELIVKLKEGLKYLPALGIKGVVQGDFLYSKKDLRKVTIDGESYITFHPNTIVYAIPTKSKLARQILASKIGVVWHTTYRGKSFESMSASFGEEIASKLRKSKDVWALDATYKDLSGSANMTQSETDDVTAILSKAGKLFNKIDAETINGISENPELLIRTKRYINMKVTDGERIKNTSKFVTELMDFIYDFYQKEIDKLKTEKGKASKEEKRKEILSYFSKIDKSQIVSLFDLYNLIVDAKLMVITKLDKTKRIGTFVKTVDGYKVTEQEGFVAIDKLGKAVKLVDRLNFSNKNFSPEFIKGWQK